MRRRHNHRCSQLSIYHNNHMAAINN